MDEKLTNHHHYRNFREVVIQERVKKSSVLKVLLVKLLLSRNKSGSSAESPPVGSPPIDSPPIDSPPVDLPPAELPPVESPPVGSPLVVESPPVGLPSAESPPVESPPVELPAVPPQQKCGGVNVNGTPCQNTPHCPHHNSLDGSAKTFRVTPKNRVPVFCLCGSPMEGDPQIPLEGFGIDLLPPIFQEMFKVDLVKLGENPTPNDIFTLLQTRYNNMFINKQSKPTISAMETALRSVSVRISSPRPDKAMMGALFLDEYCKELVFQLELKKMGGCPRISFKSWNQLPLVQMAKTRFRRLPAFLELYADLPSSSL